MWVGLCKVVRLYSVLAYLGVGLVDVEKHAVSARAEILIRVILCDLLGR